MTRHFLRRSRPTFAVALLAALAALALGGVQPARPDDTELLRFSTQNPYLMIMLDTSASMNLAIQTNTFLPGYGDNPDSRIFAAKEALFTVFRDTDDVNFGFSSFNQDAERVRGKHWLYRVQNAPSGNTFPDIGWPIADADEPFETPVVDKDGDRILDFVANPQFTGDLVVFGTTFRDANNSLVTTVGSCNSPLIDLGTATGRARLNTFAKGADQVTLWVKANGNNVYRITVGTVSNIGADSLSVKIAGELVSCNSIPGPPTADKFAEFVFRKQPSFTVDGHTFDPAQFLMVDTGPVPQNQQNSIEPTAQLWPWNDATGGFTCTNSRPFTGYGTEGNYDSGKKPSQDGVIDAFFETKVQTLGDLDRCITPSNPATCIADVKPVLETSYSTLKSPAGAFVGRPLDRGDFLPWDWNRDNHDDFLRRLAPNYTGTETPDFGIANYFVDGDVGTITPRALKSAAAVPLVAQGDTALARGLLDLRCWYMGTTGNGQGEPKCKDTPFGNEFAGWRSVACNQDYGDKDYGCRKPFFIVVTDGGGDNGDCKEQSETATVSDLDQFAGIPVWLLNLGPPGPGGKCPPGTPTSLTSSGGGKCINIVNKQHLLDTLKEILGQIREATRAFASAAVPTVQATVQQSIYVSNFTPLRSSAIWDGHMNAFLKPLPLKDGRPNTELLCSSKPADKQSECFLWDAGKVLVDTQYPFDKTCPDPDEDGNVGPCPAPNGTPTDWQAEDKRRVYYSKQGIPGTWPKQARLFQTTVRNPSDPSIEHDLWTALGIGFDPDPNALNDAARNSANAAITRALTLKQALVQDETAVRKFLLGDVFHSDPVVVGNPVDLRYFAQDLGHETGKTCDVNLGVNSDRGYRCFFTRHQFRRKVLLVGHNDGALHAFNAATYDADERKFNNGTGNELFAYMPRAVMPTVYDTSKSGATKHEFTVDSSPVVTDVFIDPEFTGSPLATDRQWRTVAIGGLREGGRAYYAIDLTQPDTLVKNSNDEIVAEETGWLPNCITDWPVADTDCGPVPYGAPLWEFTDSSNDQLPVVPRPFDRLPMDEDDNGLPDLGDTWSIPDVGRIRICTGGDCTKDTRDYYVTIFGGGLDPSRKTDPRSGNFVYMVDIETGRVLYKRTLPGFGNEKPGAIPAAPSVVDLDNDGYLDRLYVVSTGGFVYRIDLGKNSSGEYPELKPQQVQTTTDEVFDALRVDPAFWQPKLIFDAGWDAVNNRRVTRPLYYRPSVFFVAKLGLAGLAFGSGEREDLWVTDGVPGRFWVFVDDTDRVGASLPYDERQFRRIDVAGGNLGADDLFVTRNRGQKGWFFVLRNNERLITPGFALFGVMFFSSYEPLSFATTDQSCDPLECPADNPNCCPGLTQSCSDRKQNETGYCSKTGTSRLFVVNVTNGDGLLPSTSVSGNLDRFKAIAQFVTQPFTEPGQSKNPSSGTSGPTADDLTADDIKVMNIIKGLFPADCRFSNFRIDVKTIASDTSVQRIAAVPQCIVQKNWKEF